MTKTTVERTTDDERMSTSSSEERNDLEGDSHKEGTYECHICFEQARDAVVSMCGHLFCWPCIHRWMESRPNNPTCPVCKSVIQKDKMIPLYGRGSSDKKDPRDNVPPRPPGQREEPQPGAFGTGLEGINISFGIGAFPFTMLGGPVFQGGFNVPRQQQQQGHQEQSQAARFFLILATLVLVLIIFS